MRRKIVEKGVVHASNVNVLNGQKQSFFVIFLFICILLATNHFHFSSFAGSSIQHTLSMFYNDNITTNYPKREEHILKCTSSNMTIACPVNYPPIPISDISFTSNRTCPDYFRWIHEDLKTWKQKGIEQHMVESLEQEAHFRLVIVNGTAHVKQYTKAFQTRDVYSLWGILQLLKLYPGRLPDLDLMFQCHDQTSIKKDKFPGDESAFAPPQFHYCGDDSTFDIVFPDWSFWGWPEQNIKPWVSLVKDIEKGNSRKNWTVRNPIAFWKGTLFSGQRLKFLDCNSSIKDWNAEILHTSWTKEARKGFKNSDVSEQCAHRYKIYIEGHTWSVSEKYILACDSMTLLVHPLYYDFFTRSLIPMKHYWPINPTNLCKSIKFAVDWGNNNTNEAQEIGKAGSDFILKHIKIEDVYDYMFHLLNEYSKLLNYKPTVPEGAVELCSETYACSPMGRETAFKTESMVNGPSEQGPCTLPPPYDSYTLQTLQDHKTKIRELVDMLENS